MHPHLRFGSLKHWMNRVKATRSPPKALKSPPKALRSPPCSLVHGCPVIFAAQHGHFIFLEGWSGSPNASPSPKAYEIFQLKYLIKTLFKQGTSKCNLDLRENTFEVMWAKLEQASRHLQRTEQKTPSRSLTRFLGQIKESIKYLARGNKISRRNKPDDLFLIKMSVTL